MWYDFKAITRSTKACYWKLYIHANQKYLNIYEKPYIIIFIPHRGTRKEVDGMPLLVLVLLRQGEIIANWLSSLEHPVQDYTILIGNDTTPNDVIRSAILDPLSWISPFFKKAILEINTKSSQNAYKNVIIHDCSVFFNLIIMTKEIQH